MNKVREMIKRNEEIRNEEVIEGTAYGELLLRLNAPTVPQATLTMTNDKRVLEGKSTHTTGKHFCCDEHTTHSTRLYKCASCSESKQAGKEGLSKATDG